MVSRLSTEYGQNCEEARFNLAIEVLLVSSRTVKYHSTTDSLEFQSRNRGSFGFKCPHWMIYEENKSGFNLAIEVLLVSREKHSKLMMNSMSSVSISQSRFFWFQGRPFGGLTVRAFSGSDSARDAFREARRS